MIELPAGIYPQSASMRLIYFGGIVRPSLGGAVQRVNRLGNRFAMDVTLPPLTYEVGRVVVSRLLRAKSEGMRLAVLRAKGSQGSPGSSVLLNGAVTGGTAINIDGLNSGHAIREGHWLSIVQGGQHYLHNVTATVVAAAGAAALVITPEVRVALSDNAVVNLGAPMIEGFVTGDDQSWEISLAHHYSISFAIEEAG